MARREVVANNILIPEIGQLVSEGHVVTLMVKGASMSPFMVDMRDAVELGPFDPDAIKPGDVVLAKVGKEQYVLHRVIRREGDWLILKGDGNVSNCERCSLSDVLALMYSIHRKGKVIGVRSCKWRIYSCVWMFLSPLRRWLLAIWRRI